MDYKFKPYDPRPRKQRRAADRPELPERFCQQSATMSHGISHTQLSTTAEENRIPACTEIGFAEARRSEEQPTGLLTARSSPLPLTIHGEESTVGAESTQGASHNMKASGGNGLAAATAASNGPSDDIDAVISMSGVKAAAMSGVSGSTDCGGEGGRGSDDSEESSDGDESFRLWLDKGVPRDQARLEGKLPSGSESEDCMHGRPHSGRLLTSSADTEYFPRHGTYDEATTSDSDVPSIRHRSPVFLGVDGKSNAIDGYDQSLSPSEKSVSNTAACEMLWPPATTGTPRLSQIKPRHAPVRKAQISREAGSCKSCTILHDALLGALSLLQCPPLDDGIHAREESVGGSVRQSYHLRSHGSTSEGALTESTEIGGTMDGCDSQNELKSQSRDNLQQGRRRRWSKLEERRLRAWKKEQRSERWIARRLKRTESAVKQQWRKMLEERS